MKTSSEKSSSTSSRTAQQDSSHAFFAKAGGGDFFPTATSSPPVQMKMAVGKPGDKLELEADKMADKVMRMPAPASPAKEDKLQRQPDDKLQKKEEDKIQKAPEKEEKIQRVPEEKLQKKEEEKIQKAAANEEKLQRKGGDGTPAIGSGLQSSIQSQTAGGQPLGGEVRSFMEPRFGADFSNVRVHHDADSASMNNQLGARAFTHQNHVFFSGNQYQPGTSEGKQLLAHELTHTIQQGHAVQRSAQVSTTTTPSIQRFLGIHIPSWQDVIDWLADKAYNIPGYRMFTIVIGTNPINGASADRSAANILRAIVEFLPGGKVITDALQKYNVFEKAGSWVEGKLKRFSNLLGSIKSAVGKFMDDLSFKDVVLHPGRTWDRAINIFTQPVKDIISFIGSIFQEIFQFIRDAVLMPLAALADGKPGFDLLCALLGKNPITKKTVPRTPETIIGGFMKFIGQEEIWENIKKGNAVARAWKWFQTAMSQLVSLVSQFPDDFINMLKSLEIMDFIILPNLFIKVFKVFGTFAINFGKWALSTIWDLLEIIFDVVKPGIMGYIKKTGAALKSIIKNPLPFVGNLVRAAKTGFQNFASNFGEHLKAGLIDWLTGSLSGVYIPKALSLPELGKFAMSVLGITWAQIRGKIVKVLGPNGETIMKGLETGFDIVVALVTGGPAAAWELIKEKLTDLKDQVVSGIIGFVTETVIKKAVPKLIAMFIPGAGFISAIISIYDTVMVFVEKISKIIQVVVAFIDSIVTIAAGNITAASKRVERILAGLLSLAISFLAGFLGLGKITDKIKGVIEKVRASVDKAIDAVINWIVTKAKAMFGKLFSNDKKNALDPEIQKKLDIGLAAIDEAELPHKKEGKLAEEDAKQVASLVKSKHPVFKSMNVVQNGDHWQYEFVVNPPLTKAGAKTGIKNYLGATRVGNDKNKFKGKFSDPNWNWGGYPTTATPHPANKWAGSPNSTTVPKPGGSYTVAGETTGGNISTDGWREEVTKRKNREKTRLQKQNPTVRPESQEDPAKAVIEQRYNMGWLDLYLLNPWDQHHIQPINWDGKNKEQNMKYLRRDSEHVPLTTWWRARKADIIANI